LPRAVRLLSLPFSVCPHPISLFSPLFTGGCGFKRQQETACATQQEQQRAKPPPGVLPTWGCWCYTLKAEDEKCLCSPSGDSRLSPGKNTHKKHERMRGNIALPQFWSQALIALHELELTQTSLSRDGVLPQPIWDNRHYHYHPPKIPPSLRDRWESLQVTVVHNTFSDRDGTRHYTKEENQSYIDTELDYHYFQNKRINNVSAS